MIRHLKRTLASGLVLALMLDAPSPVFGLQSAPRLPSVQGAVSVFACEAVPAEPMGSQRAEYSNPSVRAEIVREAAALPAFRTTHHPANPVGSIADLIARDSQTSLAMQEAARLSANRFVDSRVSEGEPHVEENFPPYRVPPATLPPRIEVVSGDIGQLKADAVIERMDTMLVFRGKKRILETLLSAMMAVPEFGRRKDRVLLALLPRVEFRIRGEAVTVSLETIPTPGGWKHVIYALTHRPFEPETPFDVEMAIRNALQAADKVQAETVAMPIFGWDGGTFTSKEAAEMTLEAIRLFIAEDPHKHIRTISVVGANPKVAKTLQLALDRSRSAHTANPAQDPAARVLKDSRTVHAHRRLVEIRFARYMEWRAEQARKEQEAAEAAREKKGMAEAAVTGLKVLLAVAFLSYALIHGSSAEPAALMGMLWLRPLNHDSEFEKLKRAIGLALEDLSTHAPFGYIHARFLKTQAKLMSLPDLLRFIERSTVHRGALRTREDRRVRAWGLRRLNNIVDSFLWTYVQHAVSTGSGPTKFQVRHNRLLLRESRSA